MAEVATKHILLIEMDEETRDEIVTSFNNLKDPVHISEAKSFSRAAITLKDSKVDYLVIGPSHRAHELKAFAKQVKSIEDGPTIVFFDKDDPTQRAEFEKLGWAHSVAYPPKIDSLPQILDSAMKTFITHKKALSEQAAAPETTEQVKKKAQSEAPAEKPNDVLSLGLILKRLSGRLESLSDMLIEHKDTKSELVDSSIPEAVNKAILGATQLKRGNEKEDLKKLANSLTK